VGLAGDALDVGRVGDLDAAGRERVVELGGADADHGVGIVLVLGAEAQGHGCLEVDRLAPVEVGLPGEDHGEVERACAHAGLEGDALGEAVEAVEVDGSVEIQVAVEVGALDERDGAGPAGAARDVEVDLDEPSTAVSSGPTVRAKTSTRSVRVRKAVSPVSMLPSG
jgi:hypothetical protein